MLGSISNTSSKGKGHSFNLPRVDSDITVEDSAASNIIDEVDRVLGEEGGEMELARRTRTWAIRLPHRLRT